MMMTPESRGIIPLKLEDTAGRELQKHPLPIPSFLSLQLPHSSSTAYLLPSALEEAKGFSSFLLVFFSTLLGFQLLSAQHFIV